MQMSGLKNEQGFTCKEICVLSASINGKMNILICILNMTFVSKITEHKLFQKLITCNWPEPNIQESKSNPCLGLMNKKSYNFVIQIIIYMYRHQLLILITSIRDLFSLSLTYISIWDVMINIATCNHLITYDENK